MPAEQHGRQWNTSCTVRGCVQVGGGGDEVFIRAGDGSHAAGDGPVLRLTEGEWEALKTGIADGTFSSI